LISKNFFLTFQDHERIRGGLYFIKTIPRDENWKVRRDILANYEPKSAEEVKTSGFTRIIVFLELS
jgi:hypothetical protein